MVNKRGWLEESGQWLESVDWTHLVLASQYYKKELLTVCSQFGHYIVYDENTSSRTITI